MLMKEPLNSQKKYKKKHLDSYTLENVHMHYSRPLHLEHIVAVFFFFFFFFLFFVNLFLSPHAHTLTSLPLFYLTLSSLDHQIEAPPSDQHQFQTKRLNHLRRITSFRERERER